MKQQSKKIIIVYLKRQKMHKTPTKERNYFHDMSPQFHVTSNKGETLSSLHQGSHFTESNGYKLIDLNIFFTNTKQLLL